MKHEKWVQNEPKKKDYRPLVVRLFWILMRDWQRLAVYVLVTAIIEGISIVVLYSFGYPNYVHGPGYYALFVALNFFMYFLWSNAIGGPEAAPPGSSIYSPLVQLATGVVGMFIIVAVIGEGINWLDGKMMEMTGTEKKLSKFNRELDSAVHDFVDATYSSKQAQKAAETRISELYKENPGMVLECLSETYDRIKEWGTTKTAGGVEMLIKGLQDRTKDEQSSERNRLPR